MKYRRLSLLHTRVEPSRVLSNRRPGLALGRRCPALTVVATFTILAALVDGSATAEKFLTILYDFLHDSPAQQHFNQMSQEGRSFRTGSVSPTPSRARTWTRTSR